MGALISQSEIYIDQQMIVSKLIDRWLLNYLELMVGEQAETKVDKGNCGHAHKSSKINFVFSLQRFLQQEQTLFMVIK